MVNVRNQVKKPENYSFVKCEEGIPLGTDCFAIPANAEHPGTALTFINFILDPENASKNIEYMGYPMPYKGPDETFANLVKDDPGDRRHDRRPEERPAVLEPRRPRAGARGTTPGRRSRPAEAATMGDRFAARFLIPGGLWLLLFFAIPLGIVLAISFGTTDELGAAIYGWYPENYSRAFDPLFLPVLLRSVGYALATVVLCLLLGYPVAYYIADLRRPPQEHPDRARGAAVLRQLPRAHVRVGGDPVRRGDPQRPARAATSRSSSSTHSWAVIGGLVYGYLAFMILPVYAALDRMDPALIEAGKDLYGSRWATFCHVTWPTTFQGVLAGTVLVFLPAVGDFVSAQLLGGPART